MTAKNPSPYEGNQTPIWTTLQIGAALIAVLFTLLVASWSQESVNKEQACRKRVKELENTVEGRFALERAERRAPLGYDLSDTCSRQRYLEDSGH